MSDIPFGVPATQSQMMVQFRTLRFPCSTEQTSYPDLPKQGKAAAWFQPHCGIPGKLENGGWYLNRAGVLTVEHPVPKMESV
jgi:hypothetical protein